MVRPRLDSNAGEATERPSAVANGEAERLVQQTGGRVVAQVSDCRRSEMGGSDVVTLERQVKSGHIVVGSAQWANNEKGVIRLRQDDPFAASRPYKRAGGKPARKGKGGHGVLRGPAALPKTLGYLARTAGQVASSASKTITM